MPKIFQSEITGSTQEGMLAFENKFDEKLIEVTLVCECGEHLHFALPTLREVMLAFATHSC